MDEKILLAFAMMNGVIPSKSQMRLLNIMTEKHKKGESLVISDDYIRQAGIRIMDDNIRKFNDFFRSDYVDNQT